VIEVVSGATSMVICYPLDFARTRLASDLGPERASSTESSLKKPQLRCMHTMTSAMPTFALSATTSIVSPRLSASKVFGDFTEVQIVIGVVRGILIEVVRGVVIGKYYISDRSSNRISNWSKDTR